MGLRHFSMCRNISADVHELARHQRETDDNLRRQASTMGMPFAPRSPDVPLHPPPLEINEWHQQTYGVMMKKKKHTLMTASSLPRLPTKGIRVNHPLTLRPRILLEVLLPRISLGKNTLHLTWRIISLLRISLLLTGDLCIGGSLSLLFLVLVAKKGEKVSYLGSTFYLCNEHRFVIIIISLSCDAWLRSHKLL
jgi:hypothetical protein